MLSKKILDTILLILLIFLVGTAGYMVIEKWSFLESLYMTIITLTTVGFMEVRPLSPQGRIFTIIILMVGFSIILYGFGNVTAFFVEGQLMGILRRKKMDKKISRLNDHYIICGSGDMGRYVISEFANTQNQFVIVEKDEAEIKLLEEKYDKLLYIAGDASSDAVLESAGIKSAKGLITTFADDKKNLFVVLTARSLNPALRIVARSNEEESERKLKRAGANNVVSANSIGGMRMASEMIRPTVVSFLDVMLRAKDGVLRVEEAVVHENSKVAGVTIGESNILKNIGLIVIAVKDSQSREYVYNPRSDLKLNPGDTLIVLGKVEQVARLREYTGA
ncbi:MAG: potassium channel protein [Elusimicrobia bacterium]|nr:potassium channel protein [Elusimicrobiota bacterium]